MGQTVTVEVEDGVTVVTVDNPPVNAMGDQTLRELREAAFGIESDPDIRAVVVTGTGKIAFLAGADIREFDRMLDRPSDFRDHVALSRQTFRAWAALRPPTIAALQASALGGGLELALCCDQIVADPRVKLGLPEAKLGLIPGAGGTQRLAARVPFGLARWMLLSGEAIDTEQALRAGLVDRISERGEALSSAREIATRLAKMSPTALAAAKRAQRGAVEGLSLGDGLQLESELFLGLTEGPDAREGVRAFIEKRPARFGGSSD